MSYDTLWRQAFGALGPGEVLAKHDVTPEAIPAFAAKVARRAKMPEHETALAQELRSVVDAIERRHVARVATVRMAKVEITMPEAEYEALLRVARRSGREPGAWIREALRLCLGVERTDAE